MQILDEKTCQLVGAGVTPAEAEKFGEEVGHYAGKCLIVIGVIVGIAAAL